MSMTKALAELAKVAAKNGKNAVKIMEAAGAVVAAASLLVDQAKPILNAIDTDDMLNRLKDGANGVARGTEDAVSKAGAFLAKVGDSKDALLESIANAKSEKELKKTIKEARQSVLENSTITISAAEFLKKTAEAGIGPINTMPGCFVIATYKKLDFDNDLTDYISIFYDRADNVAEGVNKALSREGDADVYADVKYKQNVQIYIYNCLPEELDSLYDSIKQTFSDSTAS